MMKPEDYGLMMEGMVAVIKELTIEMRMLEKNYSEVLQVIQGLEKKGMIDDLTGLLRRGAFLTRWNSLLNECETFNQNCGVLMLDIDHFKNINDSFGHATGDEVIRRVAALLKKFESNIAFAGRLGGEEFAVALQGDDPEIMATAELIRREAERLHGPVIDSKGQPTTIEWRCTLSVGIASTQEQGYSSEALLASSDSALYLAKKGGRNQVRAA